MARERCDLRLAPGEEDNYLPWLGSDGGGDIEPNQFCGRRQTGVLNILYDKMISVVYYL
jgi:hypothetical protein